MSKSGIPYYVVQRGMGYWSPGRAAREKGFRTVACGPDGAGARARAAYFNAKWQAAKTGRPAPPVKAASGETKAGFVYFLRMRERVKIGFSVQPFSRISYLKTGLLTDDIISFAVVRGARDDERSLHALFASDRVNGEWFRPSLLLSSVIARSVSVGRIEMPVEQMENEKSHCATFPVHATPVKSMS